jgi:hypothetical protein
MPFYDLEAIQNIAKDISKIKEVRIAQRDRINLGYSKQDLANCICSLQTSHFYEEKDYNGVKMDVYKMTYSHEVEGNIHTDDLYIKLRLTSTNEIVIIGSFHLTGRYRV